MEVTPLEISASPEVNMTTCIPKQSILASVSAVVEREGLTAFSLR
ncbi:MAG: hypothetical protein ACFFCZ_29740 [Promethearchaeota archaeon]